MTPRYSGAGWELYVGDCLAVLPTLTGIDAVVTDPPYGIGFKGSNASTRLWEGIANDDGLLNLRPILLMPCLVVAFGANCYPDQLPHRGRWLCWDKRITAAADRMIGSPFELAWINRRSGFDRMYRVLHGGVVNADGANIARVHPTQKPVALMQQIIEDLTDTGETILDPFAGSGTTGVACLRTGRRFIGIEIDEHYAAIAAKRLARAEADVRNSLPFPEPEPRPKQAELWEAV